MSLTLFSISIILLINIITNEAILTIQKKIDINIELKQDLTQNEIDIFLNQLRNNENIETINYKSKQDALEDFKRRFRSKIDIIEFLDKLGENPLYASINISSKDPSLYDKIILELESDENKYYVKEVKGKQEQTKRLETLLEITETIKNVLLYISIGFSLIALMIIINTVRMTIYTRKREINIMKLVGATYSYIIWPFLVEGALYGVFATIISVSFFFPLIHYIEPIIKQYFGSTDNILLNYYIGNIYTISVWQFFIGIFVGTLSAYIAVKKHLKRDNYKK
jgi:cell division transport system permease protein